MLITPMGIWEWHSAVVLNWNELTSSISRNKLTKAAMTGNVSIIFLILPVGFIPAMIGFIFELITFRLSRFLYSAHSHLSKKEVGISSAIVTMLTEVADFAIFYANINIK